MLGTARGRTFPYSSARICPGAKKYARIFPSPGNEGAGIWKPQGDINSCFV